jgi:hypothetical protein
MAVLLPFVTYLLPLPHIIKYMKITMKSKIYPFNNINEKERYDALVFLLYFKLISRIAFV